MADETHIPHPTGKGLKNKVGPLPVWGWGALLGVGALAAMWYFSRGGSGGGYDDGIGADPMTAADDTMLPFGGSASGGEGNNPLPTDDGSDTSGDGTEYTNATWLSQAMAWLGGKGAKPLEVERALQRYLKGLPLSPHQAALVNAALKQLGAPPDMPGKVSHVTNAEDKRGDRQDARHERQDERQKRLDARRKRQEKRAARLARREERVRAQENTKVRTLHPKKKAAHHPKKKTAAKKRAKR